jgi:hypothetical protein
MICDGLFVRVAWTVIGWRDCGADHRRLARAQQDAAA